MSGKDRIGVAWERETPEGKVYISVSLDLGLLGDLDCAVFENEKGKGEDGHSTHRLVTHVGEKYVLIGSLWPSKSEATGKSYLSGKLRLANLGKAACERGEADFAKSPELRIAVFPSEKAKEADPDHHVLIARKPSETGEDPAEEGASKSGQPASNTGQPASNTGRPAPTADRRRSKAAG